METSLNITLLFSLLCILLVGCGGSNKKGGGNNENVTCGERNLVKEYSDACISDDYESAYKIVSEIENEVNRRRGYNYVLEKELLYLVAQNDEALNPRILYLLKENESKFDSFGSEMDALKKKLIGIAIELDNHSLISKLTNYHFKGKISDVDLLNYLKVQNDSLCLEYVLSFNDMELEMLTYLSEKHPNSLIKHYQGMSYLSSTDEIILAKMKDKKANAILINRLVKSEKSIEGKKLSPGIFKSKDDELGYEYEQYISSVSSYNSACEDLVQLAVNNGNYRLAIKALDKFRKNMHAEDLGVYTTSKKQITVSKYVDQSGLFGKGVAFLFGDTYDATETVTETKHKFRITFDWKDRERARNIIRNAVSDGILSPTLSGNTQSAKKKNKR